jgi:hypothetical protein
VYHLNWHDVGMDGHLSFKPHFLLYELEYEGDFEGDRDIEMIIFGSNV